MAHLGIKCRYGSARNLQTFSLTTKFPRKSYERFNVEYENKMREVGDIVKHTSANEAEAYWAIEFNPAVYYSSVYHMYTANKGEFHNPGQEIFVIKHVDILMVYRRLTTVEAFKRYAECGARRQVKGRTRYPCMRMGPLGEVGEKWPEVKAEWLTDTVNAFLNTPFADVNADMLPILADALQDADCNSSHLRWLRHKSDEVKLWGFDALIRGRSILLNEPKNQPLRLTRGNRVHFLARETDNG